MRKFSIAGVLILVAVSATGQTSIFNGTWKNSAAGRGIVQIQVNGTPDALHLQAWGACTPEPCDWGIVRAWAYSDSAATPITEATAITATFTSSFAERIVVLSMRGPRLRADTYTRFTDGSGRASYHTTESFVRSE